MKTRILGIFLFLCLVAPCAIRYASLQFEKQQVKRFVKQQIATLDATTYLVLSKKDAQTALDWADDHEFEYNSQMYDVLSYTEQGDSVYYHVWLDQEETQLNKKLASLVLSAWANHPFKQKSEVQLKEFFKSFFYCTMEPYRVCIIETQMVCDWPPFGTLSHHAPSTPAPPPKLV